MYIPNYKDGSIKREMTSVSSLESSETLAKKRFFCNRLDFKNIDIAKRFFGVLTKNMLE